MTIGEAAADILKEPNNILAVEYLKQLHMMERGAASRSGAAEPAEAARLKPITFKRTGAGYFGVSPDGNIAGASALRDMLLSGRDIEARAYMPAAVPGAARAKAVAPDSFFTLTAGAARARGARELAETLSA